MENKKPKNKGGRPTVYDPIIVLPRTEQLCSKGATDKQLGKAFGVSETTINDWKHRFPEFALSIKKYKGLANIEVENALFKSAIGFDFEEKTHARVKVGQKYKMVVKETTVKHVSGNATAQIFYLCNRMPDRYKRKIETEISIPASMESITFTAKRREA